MGLVFESFESRVRTKKSRIIVCGLRGTGYKVFRLLKRQGAEVVGINDQPLAGEPDIVVGNTQAADTLLMAGIREAQTLVLTENNDGLNLEILMQARILNPRNRVVNRLFNSNLGDRLDQTLSDHITMSVSALSAPIFAFAALGSAAIGQLRLFNQTWPIHQEYIDESHPWCGRMLSDLWDDRSRMLIYYLPVDEQTDLISAVIQGNQLQVGDRLIIGTKPNVRATHRSLKQRLTKMVLALKYLKHRSRSIAYAALLLLTVIATGTVVFSTTVLKQSPIDALYFSVSMITGAGDSLVSVEHVPAQIKLFTVFLMLVGAAIIGLSYALLNDFILGTRFDRFWEVTQVPQRHHFIICGLGGVGVQTVNHLRSYGHEVVVIEPDPNCRFLSTVRSMKIPVIQGDAKLPATLKAANFEQAQALIAVTSSDTDNLEISLNAKSLNPKIAVVVRYQEPDFAGMAQMLFGFESVLSPADLVAPAFAAAALGGRILGNGMAADSLWVALATLITPAHPFCGQQVQEVAKLADCVPLYLETQSREIHGWELLSINLVAGDVLYLTMPANRLDELWRSTPSPSMTHL